MSMGLGWPLQALELLQVAATPDIPQNTKNHSQL